MKIWSALFNMIAILLILLLVSAFFNTVRVLERDFDQARLNYAVEFSTRAMFEKTLEIEDLDMDYVDISNVQINSSDALDTFTELMCINYDMSTSDENKSHIENSIASAVLASRDGYYITQLVVDDIINENDTKVLDNILKWSPKIPYYIHKNGRVYAVNFTEKTYTSIKDYKAGATSDPAAIMISTVPGLPSGVNDRDVLNAVNNQITDTIMNEIRISNMNRKSVDYKFYLPLDTTVKGVNPIDGPGVLMILQGVDYASPQKLNAMSVSGYKVVEKVNVLGIKKKDPGDNRLYYCYETQMYNDYEDYEVVNYFANIRDAAENGYSPHYEFLARKITK